MVSVSLAWRPKGTALDNKKSDGGGRENRKKQKFEQEKMSPQNHLRKVKPKEKNLCMNKDKSSNYGLRGSQDGDQTLHPLAKFFT